MSGWIILNAFMKALLLGFTGKGLADVLMVHSHP